VSGRWHAACHVQPTRRGTGEIERAVAALDRAARPRRAAGLRRDVGRKCGSGPMSPGPIARVCRPSCAMRNSASLPAGCAAKAPVRGAGRIPSPAWTAPDRLESSARHAHLFAKEYETERNNQIVFAFDCGAGDVRAGRGRGTAMPRIDRAVSAALATAYVALKGGDRVALFGFAERPEPDDPFIAGSGEFYAPATRRGRARLHAQEPISRWPGDPGRPAPAPFAGRRVRRFHRSDQRRTDDREHRRLVRAHVVLFVTMADEPSWKSAGRAGRHAALAMAVTADGLLRQRALVLRRLRQLGVDVIEAPWARSAPG
jgi:hypothetical protein